jgi:hypothetical protein
LRLPLRYDVSQSTLHFTKFRSIVYAMPTVAYPALGAEHLAEARRIQRDRRMEQRRRDRAEALAVLHRARDAFCEHVGNPCAARDGDVLEQVADRLIEWLQGLEPEFERLGPARDQALYRGPVLTHVRASFEPRALAERIVETLGEAALSREAEAVLLAAVRYATV